MPIFLLLILTLTVIVVPGAAERSSTPVMNGKSDEREPTRKQQVQVNDHQVKRNWLQIDDKSLIILGRL